ncbi:MAG: HAD-IA family hydrolase, partial [Planctomycetes bacterium]|nr:HAD-IA family hydrolase [Planctomycetota bacterium]
MISNYPENKHSQWAVIFDVDGTMVDNMQYHESAWIELGRRHGLAIDHKFYLENIHSRNNDQTARKHFAPALGIEKALALGEEKEKIYRETYRHLVREIPGLTDLLGKLERLNVSCAVASNSPTDNVNMILEELGIKQFFKVVMDYTQISKGKPDPEILLTAAERLGVAADRCVVVEDSIS